MAREAKTIRQHLLHGTVPQGKPEKPSAYQGGRPKFPSHLSKVGRQEMKRVVRILLARGTATEGDYAVAAMYGEIYARWVELKRQVGAEYMVTTQVTDNNGNLRTVTRINPLLKILAQTESRLQSLTKELGLSPKERDKVKPTSANQAEDVVPGSMADKFPELFVVKEKK
jgi:P27 family predicted phage terminase small subunit